MSAYYNENDPRAAAWLRELIRAGLIAPGEVDERDIRDVCADELRGFTQHHFFAGIGVWSYALRSAGWEDDRPVWTGSCPCQPFSAAGGRAGFADERHLWPSWFWLIEAFGPRTVFGEQVASKDGLAWLDVVQADMEGAGYAFGALDLCAAGFGAPHIRQRAFFVADAVSAGRPEGRAGAGRGSPAGGGRLDELADTSGARRVRQVGGAEGQARDEARLRVSGENGIPSALAVTDSRQRGRLADGEGCERDGQATGRIESDGESQSGCVDGGLADSNGGNARAERQQRGGQQRQLAQDDKPLQLADADAAGSQGWSGGRNGADECAARTSSLGGEELPGPTNGIWRAADWLLCRDGKWRPVSPGTFPLVDGSAARVGRLRGYGNAIVAPVAQAFIEAVMIEIDRASLIAE